MKSDLDRLMTQRGLEALIVVSDHSYNAPRDYLTNGARVSGGLVIKKRGADPVMVVNSMEIEEAAESGLTVYYQEDWANLFREARGDKSPIDSPLWARCLEKLGIPHGKIGVYGKGDVNIFIDVIDQLNAALQHYRFIGETGYTIFDEASVTKDSTEMARIKSIAERTSAVWQATWDFIASHRAEGDTVVKSDGTPLTIGDVKGFVMRALLDHGLENAEMIFAQGRDGGFPHSRGKADMALKTGQAIVFDLFPHEVGGGYHHDSTRTWCINYAPSVVQEAYDQVMEAFRIAHETFEEPGQPAHTLQDAVLDYFEGKGHQTLRSKPDTIEGYVHGLGHGVGMKIHERPKMSHINKDDRLQIGNTLTIEPGLYYPERGFGVRVEDMLYIDENGKLVTLTNFHKDLVLPLRG
jgi:Xaa-Pro aminopeptidase